MIKLSDALKSKKHILLIAVTAAVGLLLLLFPGEESTGENGDAEDYQSVISYTEKLEERIRNICLAVDGIDRVSVLVTLESGSEYVYADNITEDKHSETSSAYTSDYLIVESDDGTSPVLVTEIYPKIRGVAVVCDGGDGALMQKKLTELLSAALGISTSRIKITS